MRFIGNLLTFTLTLFLSTSIIGLDKSSDISVVPDPNGFINIVETKIIEASEEQDWNHIKDIIDNYLAKEMIANFVLGKYAHSTSTEQKQHFVQEYGEYITNHYGKKLLEYGKKIQRQKVATIAALKNNIYKIDTKIYLNDRDPAIDLSYMLFLDENNNFKIFDFVIEKIRLAITGRSEVYAILDRMSIDEYTRVLAQNNKENRSVD